MTLGVVQAAYRLDLGEREWLTGIVEAIRPELDSGFGVGGVIFDASEPSRFSVSQIAVVGASRLLERAFGATFKLLGPRDVKRTFRAPVWFTSTSDLLGPGERFLKNPVARLVAHPVGVVDLLTFKASRPSHHGVMIAGASRTIRSVSPREVRRWAYTAAHVAAAHRLRARLNDLSLTEAVLSPAGKLLHAEAPAQARSARQALRAAAVRLDRIRARTADDPDVLETWTALIEGRWSLIDHFDSDGRRFLVVRRNDPQVPDPRALSLRERQVVAHVALGHSNKLCAYEMGLAPSTVAEHLKSALRKLGLRTRAELAHLLQAGSAKALRPRA